MESDSKGCPASETRRMEQKPNPEVLVMDAALRLLSNLQPDEQRRVPIECVKADQTEPK